ncbi:MAG: FkbM family methyltransferase [Sulfolobales archaeon]
MEPNPLAVKFCIDNIRALRWLIARKRLNVKILNRAVWDSEGVVDLRLSWWSEGHHVGLESYGDGVKVRTVTLNDILKLTKGKTIIKMDIEGAEYRVLKNADLRGVHMITVEAYSDPNVIAKILRA